MPKARRDNERSAGLYWLCSAVLAVFDFIALVIVLAIELFNSHDRIPSADLRDGGLALLAAGPSWAAAKKITVKALDQTLNTSRPALDSPALEFCLSLIYLCGTTSRFIIRGASNSRGKKPVNSGLSLFRLSTHSSRDKMRRGAPGTPYIHFRTLLVMISFRSMPAGILSSENGGHRNPHGVPRKITDFIFMPSNFGPCVLGSRCYSCLNRII